MQYYNDDFLRYDSARPRQRIRTCIVKRIEYFRQFFSFRENDLKL